MRHRERRSKSRTLRLCPDCECQFVGCFRRCAICKTKWRERNRLARLARAAASRKIQPLPDDDDNWNPPELHDKFLAALSRAHPVGRECGT